MERTTLTKKPTSTSTRKKTHFKIVPKHKEDLNSSNTKNVRELLQNGSYNFLSIRYFCFVSFIISFTFSTLKSSVP